MQEFLNVEGFKIPKELISHPCYPDPPDEPRVPSKESMTQYECYRNVVEQFYENYCKVKCNCDELSKNRQLCPIHDANEIYETQQKFKNLFKWK